MKTHELDSQKKKMSLKSMYFNRFLMIRYVIALFLFSNLYWFVFAIGTGNLTALVPAVLLFFAGRAIFEQILQLDNHRNQIPKAKHFFLLQLIVNALILIVSLFGSVTSIFPFFQNTNQTNSFVQVIVLFGLLLAVLNLRKIHRIENNKDTHFQRIVDYEHILKEER